MTRPTESHIRDALTSLISPQLIRRRAWTLGVVKRRRRVDIVALVYTLVLGFDRGAQRTLASLRRSYVTATGVTLAPSVWNASGTDGSPAPSSKGTDMLRGTDPPGGRMS